MDEGEVCSSRASVAERVGAEGVEETKVEKSGPALRRSRKVVLGREEAEDREHEVELAAEEGCCEGSSEVAVANDAACGRDGSARRAGGCVEVGE